MNDAPDWHLDVFEIHGNVVKIQGWLFDPSAPEPVNRVFVVDDAGRCIAEVSAIATNRADVALHKQTLDALWAGFEAYFYVDSPKPLYFFLRHDGQESVPVGTVPANSGSAYVYVRSLSKDEAQKLMGQDLKPEASSGGCAIAAQELRVADASDSLPAAFKAYLSDASRPAIVAVTHSLGGGAEQYLAGRQKSTVDQNTRFLTVRFDEAASDFICEAHLDDGLATAHFPDLEAILNTVPNIASIWVNEVVGYPNIASALQLIAGYAKAHRAALEFMVHDYGSICQSYNLVDAEGVFCDLPPYDKCRECFRLIRRDDFSRAGIAEYRGVWEHFLLSCDTITAFSEDSRRLLGRAYPSLIDKGTVRVVPHEVAPLRSVRVSPSDKTVIGVIGQLSHNKGLDVVRDIIALIEQNDTGAELVLIGEATEDIPSITRRQTGRYVRDELPAILEREGVNVVLIPSICPETFSFTASEAMDMGLPVAVFDIGAPAERVRCYEKGLVLDVGTKPADVVEALCELKASHAAG